MNIYSLFILLSILKIAYSLTQIECIQQLIEEKNSGSEITYFGNDGVYCTLLNDEIYEITFQTESNIDEWSIISGKWDNENSTFEAIEDSTVNAEDEKYRIAVDNGKVNSIVWSSDSDNSISNVIFSQLKLNLKRASKLYDVFSNGKFNWEDISWDQSYEKIITENLINVNNTNYFDTIGIYLNDPNEFFDSSYTLQFNITSDSPQWMVYTGYYDDKTYEINICEEWDLSTLYQNITVNEKVLVVQKLNKDNNSCSKNNIIWWQNISNNNISQRVWLSDISLFIES